MTLAFVVQTVIEMAGISLLLYGFWHEDKLIAFEDRLKTKILDRKEAKNDGKTDSKRDF